METKKIVFSLKNDFIWWYSILVVKNCKCSSNFFIADILYERKKKMNQFQCGLAHPPRQQHGTHLNTYVREKKKERKKVYSRNGFPRNVSKPIFEN